MRMAVRMTPTKVGTTLAAEEGGSVGAGSELRGVLEW